MTDYGARYLSDLELSNLPLRNIGKHVLIDATASLINLENISIGDHARIDANTVIIATGPVTIGKYVHIAGQGYLGGLAGIEMGDFSGLSHGVRIYSASDDYSGRSMTNPTVPKRLVGTRKGPVRIGRHVVIGSGSVVFPDVTLGEGCAIGALSLVNHSVGEWTIYAGAPIRFIKHRERMPKKLELDVDKNEEPLIMGH